MPIAPAHWERNLAIVGSGLSTAVLMWLAGYLLHFPGVHLPGPAIFVVLAVILVAGGFGFGRRASAQGPVSGATAAIVCGGINLLILGSVLRGHVDDAVQPAALIRIPGALLAHVLLFGAGQAAGRRMAAAPLDWVAWRSRVIASVVGATLLVVIAGGIVTSTGTGFAVPDWPGTFGSNMFLYPLSQMTGGIYYEHAHRLYGALVGFATIIMLGVILATESRRWVKHASALLLLLVILQGVAGGSWVLTAHPGFVVLHGAFGQIYFALTGVMLAVTSRAWLERRMPVELAGAQVDRSRSLHLAIALLVQLLSGVLYRHLKSADQVFPWPAHLHLSFMLVVIVFACLAGFRAWARADAVPLLGVLGRALLVVLVVQLILGFGALFAVMAWKGEPYTAQVILTTAHQANGAILLLLGVQLLLWTWRCVGAPRPAAPAARLPAAS